MSHSTKDTKLPRKANICELWKWIMNTTVFKRTASSFLFQTTTGSSTIYYIYSTSSIKKKVASSYRFPDLSFSSWIFFLRWYALIIPGTFFSPSLPRWLKSQRRKRCTDAKTRQWSEEEKGKRGKKLQLVNRGRSPPLYFLLFFFFFFFFCGVDIKN